MARQPKIKYNAVRVLIEAVIETQSTASEDIAESISSGLDDLRGFGMAKVIKTEPCEYPSYEEFNKDYVSHLEYGNGRVYVRID